MAELNDCYYLFKLYILLFVLSNKIPVDFNHCVFYKMSSSFDYKFYT